jgi:hypothetical protein
MSGGRHIPEEERSFRAGQYRRMAAEALARSNETEDDEVARAYLALAARWRRLADQIDGAAPSA